MRRLLALLFTAAILIGANAPDYRAFTGLSRDTDRTLVEVQATITSPTCTFVSRNSWCAAWVALENGGIPPWNIVQVGYIIFPPIWGRQVHYFWAAGDAASGRAPYAQDLGPAAPGAHHFRVRVVTTYAGRTYDRVQMYIDGRLVATSPLAATPWVEVVNSASWQCELAVHGDRCAVTFTRARIRVEGGSSVAAFRGWVGYRERGLAITSTTTLRVFR